MALDEIKRKKCSRKGAEAQSSKIAATISAPLRLCVRFSAAWLGTVISASALAQEKLPGIKRLDDITRAKALAALASLIILGFAMILLTWLGARITQRYRNSSAFFKPTIRPGEHEWSRKPLGEADTKGKD